MKGALIFAVLCLAAPLSAQQPVPKTASASTASVRGMSFDTPQQAADALIEAAARFDVPRLNAILGPDGEDIVTSGESARDRQRAANFVAQAREEQSIADEPEGRASLVVGQQHWPFPVPIVKRGGKWFFDAKAGKQEILNRRIGENELDAIGICRGYVEAQHEFALEKREDNQPNQYAQRIISTPGKQDGLAWQNADGTWGGPVGENIARAIQQGYVSRGEPYHGYFFKVLKGQGPAAPLGQLDFVVKGLMIGGFALVAAPAEYGVTGVKTFIVSHDGIVYEQDFGATSLAKFKNLERYNPDDSWTPVPETSGERDVAGGP